MSTTKVTLKEKREVYLDYNATTPLEPEVLDSIQEALQNAWGNPSSSHHTGRAAKEIIDTAREDIAAMIHSLPGDIVFTSGGTEANNMIIYSAIEHYNNHELGQISDGIGEPSRVKRRRSSSKGRQPPHIISSLMEHPAVNMYLDHLVETGQAEVTYVKLSHTTGCLEVDNVVKAVRPNTILVTVMLANNETGLIQPVQSICEAVRILHRKAGETQQIFVHTDAAQAVGKISVNVETLGVDYLTVVGHKYYGPRIGALYARNLGEGQTPLYPMLHGGGQEKGYRPGTQNTGMIAGLGMASRLVCKNLEQYYKHMLECRDYLEEQLQATFGDRVRFNGKFVDSDRLPNTCNFSIVGPNLQGHKVLSACTVLQASVGAACHSQNRPSAILLAIGIPENIARNALRLSVGRETTKADIDLVVADLQKAVAILDQSHSKGKRWVFH